MSRLGPALPSPIVRPGRPRAAREVAAAIRIVPALLVALLAAAPAAAQTAAPPPGADPAFDARAREVASGLRCPVCEGLSIQDSPTDLAREMKGVIREQLAAGRSADEVRAYFVDRYGEWVLLQPRPEGFNLVVYILPFLALLAGAAIVVTALRRWTRPRPSAPTAAAD